MSGVRMTLSETFQRVESRQSHMRWFLLARNWCIFGFEKRFHETDGSLNDFYSVKVQVTGFLSLIDAGASVKSHVVSPNNSAMIFANLRFLTLSVDCARLRGHKFVKKPDVPALNHDREAKTRRFDAIFI